MAEGRGRVFWAEGRLCKGLRQEGLVAGGVGMGGALSVGSGEPRWVFEEVVEWPVGSGSWDLTVERGYRVVGGQRGSGPWALWRGPLWDTCPGRRLGKGPSWGLTGLASPLTVDKSPSLSEKQGQQYPLS